jgi:hypothetical protein
MSSRWDQALKFMDWEITANPVVEASRLPTAA